MIRIVAVLALLTAVTGCAAYTHTTSSAPASGSAARSPRDPSGEDCRGVWDQLARVCIGG